MSEEKPVILTCAQSTGKLHLGNYLGAIRNWVSYQEGYECFFGIVDMHAITVPYNPSELRKSSLDCIAQYIACGLDPAKCSLFLQSHVIGHTELAWVLGCLTPLGRLERMTQFKDKSRKQQDEGSAGFIGSGLLTYPVLMAADILLYNADRVPVGEDQKQHLELTRDIATKFNETYSPTFKVPEIDIPKQGARVMSLQNPQSKMSKSDPNQAGSIYLLDEPAVIRKKFQSAVTDSDPDRRISADKQDSGIPNLLEILSAVSGKSIEALEGEFSGASYADFKGAVADAVVDLFEPIQAKYKAISQDKSELNRVLKAGADSAQKRAYKTMSKVYRKAGFVERIR
ncbi:tryptophan--tRNA ligase [Rubellicoccus peritrichatus]|uniref:Tryptophan--tRNA ligase n=1 Tax=Rubellicoccus peritrichatus TaxID=3080537 RepID=A0AAQ3L922_9BACT|nr:tryptophan--tRNA ligase [Puniceicoccus sp. CR14]WOO39937.1 tryptophan--tRNA ligase [Puniceicoccus sp. CR14]